MEMSCCTLDRPMFARFFTLMQEEKCTQVQMPIGREPPVISSELEAYGFVIAQKRFSKPSYIE